MANMIPGSDLVPMDLFAAEPIRIDLVYADAAHPDNIFATAFYHAQTRLSLHRELAAIVVATARFIFDQRGQRLVLKDGLRPVDAQAAMAQTQIVKDNPHWLVEPGRLLSPPGAGAHPRGMAIDVAVEADNGAPVDMGTTFDTMTSLSARDYQEWSAEILENRRLLEEAFVAQAARLSLPLLPLPSEWWDFRLPRSHYEGWNALADQDLPPPLRTIAPEAHHTDWAERFDKTAKQVLNSL